MMTDTLQDRLGKLSLGDDAVLNIFRERIESLSPLYCADFFLLGVAKRTLSLSSGFRSLIEARNFTCAAALVRMQIDTALRVFAGTLVESSEDYAIAVLRGDPINKIKDRLGNLMRDAYLVEQLAPHYPWMPRVYKETNELVHFTSRHIFASATNIDPETRRVSFQITAVDPPRPDADYFEVVDGYYAAMQMTIALAAGWHDAIHASHD